MQLQHASSSLMRHDMTGGSTPQHMQWHGYGATGGSMAMVAQLGAAAMQFELEFKLIVDFLFVFNLCSLNNAIV